MNREPVKNSTSSINEQNYKEEDITLEEGEYCLSLAQIFHLNKKLSHGFKLELWENMSKHLDNNLNKGKKKHRKSRESSDGEIDKSVKKKKKSNMELMDGNKSKDDSSLSNAMNNSKNANNMQIKRSLREKKPTLIKDLGYIDKESTKTGKSGVAAEIFKKCDKIFQKLKKNQLASIFLTSSGEAPSLALIEKNLKSYMYNSVFQFGMDVRKIWNYYFTNYSNNTEIYQKTFTLSNYFEEIFKDTENSYEEKPDIVELQKKVNKLNEKLNEMNQNKNTTQNNKRDRSIVDKPMTMQEKNQLGNQIRQLNPEQLKGIIKILSDSLPVDQNNKYFEFDIEMLNTKKLRELERYVKNCLKNNTVKKKPGNEETDNINKLKNDLAQTKDSLTNHTIKPAKSNTNNNNNMDYEEISSNNNNNFNTAAKVNQEPKLGKTILSDSASVSSSSEGSDSESLSELDFNKKKIK